MSGRTFRKCATKRVHENTFHSRQFWGGEGASKYRLIRDRKHKHPCHVFNAHDRAGQLECLQTLILPTVFSLVYFL